MSAYGYQYRYDPRQPQAPMGGPPETPPPAQGGGERVDIVRAFKYLFDQPGWKKTMLMCTLYMFIPAVGPIAVQGYFMRLVKQMIARGDDRDLPPLEGFGDLISMGIKPFIGTMVYMMPAMIILYVVWFAAFFFVGLGSSLVMLAMKGSEAGGAIGALLIVLAFAVVFILLMAGTIALMYPLKAILTAVEVTGKFEYAWKFKEILAYLRALRPHYLKAFLGIQVGNMICIFLGMLLCYVGMFPAMTIAMAANAHVRAQLYRIYLARGGPPFPWGPEA